MSDNFTVFNSCSEVDELFRESRLYFNELYIKKMAVNSIFFNRIETQTWPMNSLPTQQAFRFGRGWYNPLNAWEQVQSGRCVQNEDTFQFENIAHPGTESYTFSLYAKYMRTNFYQLTDFMYRLFPEEEMAHILETNVNITKNVHEEFSRTQWIGGSGHHWCPVGVNNSLVSCAMIDDQMFMMKNYQGTNEGSFDSTYVYVKLPVSQLDNIGLLSLETLDDILIDLQREDDAYRLDVTELVGRPVLEVILPDARVLRQLWSYAKQSYGWWDCNSDFDDNQKKAALGIDRVVGNYALCYDINGWRGNVDWTYNASLPTFNANDPDTWPRIKRVLPYYPVSSEIGCKWIQNPLFRSCDFAITIPYVNKAMVKWLSPSQSGIGEAQGMTQNYAGDWQWKNPDWPCNIKGDQGFFWNQFRMGMQFLDPTLMHSVLHRLNDARLVIPAPCPLTQNFETQVTPDCFSCDVDLSGPTTA